VEKNSIDRVTGMIVFEAEGAAPNNSPEGDLRMTPDGHAWVSGVSFKRKIRDVLEDHSSPIFLELAKKHKLDVERFHISESWRKGMSDDLSHMEVRNAAEKLAQQSPGDFCNKYVDVRTFGTTFITKDPKDEKKEYRIGRDKNAKLVKTGCVTVGQGFSVAPVEIIEDSMTKKAPLRSDLIEIGTGDIASMSLKFIRHGLFCQKFGVNPQWAHRTRTSQQDIDVIKDLIKYLFISSASCTRPLGSINLIHAWWGKHSSPLGSFKERDFYKCLMPTKIENPLEPSTSTDEYHIPGADAVSDLDVELLDVVIFKNFAKIGYVLLLICRFFEEFFSITPDGAKIYVLSGVSLM